MRRIRAGSIAFRRSLEIVLAAALLTSVYPLSAQVRLDASARLVLLPYPNESKDAELDYLKNGIPETMISTLSDIGFVIQGSATVFALRPLAEPGAGIMRANTPEHRYMEVSLLGLSDKTFKAFSRGDMTEIARLSAARYVIYGSFVAGPVDVTGERSIEVRTVLFDAASGRRYENKKLSTIRTLYEELPSVTAELRTHVEVPLRYAIKFETADPGGMLFLDEQYLGRTPVEAILPAGKYRLRLEQEGKTPIEETLEVTQTRVIALRNESVRQVCLLEVDSTPAGAEVFLDMTKIGTTPLARKDMPPGLHRVRVSLKDHVDRFSGVDLREDKPVALKMTLVPGDTLKVFRDPGYVVFDWDYHDLAFYSFINSLAFYGGWVYFNTKADRTESSLRRTVSTSLTSVVGLAGASLPVQLYTDMQIEQNRRNTLVLQRYAKASGWGGGLMLVCSGFFFWRGFESDYRETGELGAAPVFFRTEIASTIGPYTDRRFDAGLTMRF